MHGRNRYVLLFFPHPFTCFPNSVLYLLNSHLFPLTSYLYQINPGEGKRATIQRQFYKHFILIIVKLLAPLIICSFSALKPGEGARALRFALCPFPAPGFKSYKGTYFKRSRNQHAIQLATHLKKSTATKRTPFFPPPGVIHGYRGVKEKKGNHNLK